MLPAVRIAGYSLSVRPADSVATLPRWEHFAHGADIGVRGIGRSLAEAFEQAALALTAVVAGPETVRAEDAVDVACDAADADVLLVDWLNALIYEMATRRMLFGSFHVRIDHGRLAAAARGETVDPPRHQPAVEIKGATYTALKVEQRNDGTWLAQCVVDV